jgi:hypothetical protein
MLRRNLRFGICGRPSGVVKIAGEFLRDWEEFRENSEAGILCTGITERHLGGCFDGDGKNRRLEQVFLKGVEPESYFPKGRLRN